MTTAPDPQNSQFLAAALIAAEQGWFVFPVRRGGKQPAVHGDQPGRPCPRIGPCRDGHQGWEQRATRDPAQIRQWWTGRFAGCNIGIACGPSNLLAIDLDMPQPAAARDAGKTGWTQQGEPGGGWATLAQLCRQAGQPLPPTLTVATPRGGIHLYYRQPAGMRLGNTRGNTGGGLGPLVDTRGHGGYILAPHSTVPAGVYRVLCTELVAELPGWLVHALTPKPATATTAPVLSPTTTLPGYVTAALQGEADRVATAPSGAHTGVLFTAAIALGQLVGAALLPLGTAEGTLYTAATHMITGPCACTEREIHRTITNGLRRGTAQPRLPRPRRHGRTT